MEKKPLGSCFHTYFTVSSCFEFGCLQDIFFINHSRSTGIVPVAHYIWSVPRPVLLCAQGKANHSADPHAALKVTALS